MKIEASVSFGTQIKWIIALFFSYFGQWVIREVQEKLRVKSTEQWEAIIIKSTDNLNVLNLKETVFL